MASDQSKNDQKPSKSETTTKNDTYKDEISSIDTSTESDKSAPKNKARKCSSKFKRYIVVKTPEAKGKPFKSVFKAMDYMQGKENMTTQYFESMKEAQEAANTISSPQNLYVKPTNNILPPGHNYYNATPNIAPAQQVTPNKNDFEIVATIPRKKPPPKSINFSEHQTSTPSTNDMFTLYQPPEHIKEEVEQDIKKRSTMANSTLVFTHIPLENFIIVTINMLDPRNHEYWCFKPEAIQTCFTRNDIDVPLTDPMHNLQIFTMRKDKHGSDEPKRTLNKKRNTYYETRAIFTNMAKDPSITIEQQVETFGQNFKQVLTNPKFAAYYLYILQTSNFGNIMEIIKHKNNVFWNHLTEANIKIINGHHLDAVFLDDAIVNFVKVMCQDRGAPVSWDYQFKRALYKSANLPPNFPSEIN